MKNILCIFGLLCVCAVLGSCKRIYQITKESTTEGPTLNDILDDSGVLYNDNERHVAQVSNMLTMNCTILWYVDLSCMSRAIYQDDGCGVPI